MHADDTAKRSEVTEVTETRDPMTGTETHHERHEVRQEERVEPQPAVTQTTTTTTVVED
ncbi:hypothetical protein [Deinococcus aquaedulcis]|uniref:hypothetical protein n=1 Tax=Deinococcus aquaedulcis TaxID=2840455 RepID=UPI001C83A38A|nr:hypothetical protein [Deinococcus aquaedulcis]